MQEKYPMGIDLFKNDLFNYTRETGHAIIIAKGDSIMHDYFPLKVFLIMTLGYN